MSKRSVGAALIALLWLSACGTTMPTSTVRLEATTSYPNLPDIPKPPPLDLQEFKYDMPRDKSGAIIPDSNVFIGFDQSNWQIFLENQKRIEARDRMWETRIDEENKLRAEWRAKNAQQAQPPAAP